MLHKAGESGGIFGNIVGKFFGTKKTEKENLDSDRNSVGSSRSSFESTASESSVGVGALGGKKGSFSKLVGSFSRDKIGPSGVDSKNEFKQLIKMICKGVDADNPSVTGFKRLLSAPSVGSLFMTRFGDKLISLNKAIDKELNPEKKEKILSQLNSMESEIEQEIKQFKQGKEEDNLNALMGLNALKNQCVDLKNKIAPQNEQEIHQKREEIVEIKEELAILFESHAADVREIQNQKGAFTETEIGQMYQEEKEEYDASRNALNAKLVAAKGDLKSLIEPKVAPKSNLDYLSEDLKKAEASLRDGLAKFNNVPHMRASAEAFKTSWEERIADLKARIEKEQQKAEAKSKAPEDVQDNRQ